MHHHLQRLMQKKGSHVRSTVTEICQKTNYRALTTTPGVSNKETQNNNDDTPKRPSYVDEWFESIIKPAKFYEDYAAPGRKRKIYFYNVDLQGRVFLEETSPKNIATSIKNTQFLDFLFSRLKRVEDSSREKRILIDYGSPSFLRNNDNNIEQDAPIVGDAATRNNSDIAKDYPYVSPCGVELNFIRPADSVIVFHSLLQKENTKNGTQNTIEEEDNNDKEQQHQQLLSFAGSLVQPFDPQKLAISPITGRLYHELVTPENDSSSKKLATPLHTTKNGRSTYGLIRSSVAVSISEHIVFNNDQKENQQTTDDIEEYSELDYVLVKDDAAAIDNDKNIMPSSYPIRWLPSYAEPGSWAMPFHDGINE